MPHLVLQYSANLQEAIEAHEVVQRLHACALASGVFPEGGTRTRAIRCDLAEIADGHPDNAFVDLQIRIGQGRDEETRQRVGESLMAVLVETLGETPHASALAISAEIQEIDSRFSWRQNTLHERLAERRAEGKGEA